MKASAAIAALTCAVWASGENWFGWHRLDAIAEAAGSAIRESASRRLRDMAYENSEVKLTDATRVTVSPTDAVIRLDVHARYYDRTANRQRARRKWRRFFIERTFIDGAFRGFLAGFGNATHLTFLAHARPEQAACLGRRYKSDYTYWKPILWEDDSRTNGRPRSIIIEYSSAYFAAFAHRVLKMIKRANANCKVGIAENDGHFIAIFINRK
jgi:hypothetical protein